MNDRDSRRSETPAGALTARWQYRGKPARVGVQRWRLGRAAKAASAHRPARLTPSGHLRPSQLPLSQVPPERPCPVHAQHLNGLQTGSLLQLIAIAAASPLLNRGEYQKITRSYPVASLAI